MTLNYCGSVQYTAVAQYANTTAYTVGQIIRQLATPSAGNERCFICTVAGTTGAAEPAWNTGKATTTVAGTASFKENTGVSWLSPFASMKGAANGSSWMAPGDTCYIASNHAATQASSLSYGIQGTSAAPCKFICVDPAGSVPPVAADMRYTATETVTGNNTLDFSISNYAYIQGVNFFCGGTLFFAVGFGSNGMRSFYRCNFALTGTGGTFQGQHGTQVTINLTKCNLTFSNFAQFIVIVGTVLNWRGGSVLGVAPNILVDTAGSTQDLSRVLIEGVDLTLLTSATSSFLGRFQPNSQATINFINCKINNTVGRLGGGSGNFISRPPNVMNMIVTSGSANSYNQESYQPSGQLTTETAFTLVGGASDGQQLISWKMVTNANGSVFVPTASFPIARWNTVVGSPVTATVEIESNATLTSQDIWLECEVLDAAGAPISTIYTTQPDVLTAGANLPLSAKTWNGGLSGAVKQYLQLTFTPALVGLIRATVYIGKISQTVYINPQLTLT